MSSLLILMPPLHFTINVAIKIALGFLIVAATFLLKKQVFTFLKTLLTFLIMNFIYAGLMLALWLFSSPLGMNYNNGYAYFNISFLAILIFTAIAYGVVRLIRYRMDSNFSSDERYEIKIKYRGAEISLCGFADSGNTVVDYFSGLPVIVCSKEKFSGILPGEILECDTYTTQYDGIRLLPFNTVGHSGIMPVFKPDEITITGHGVKEGKDITTMVGIANSFAQPGIEAVFNPKILL